MPAGDAPAGAQSAPRTGGGRGQCPQLGSGRSGAGQRKTGGTEIPVHPVVTSFLALAAERAARYGLDRGHEGRTGERMDPQ